MVATRRTRTAGKVDIPSIEDHVSKLEHMGKETVKKLQDIHGAAMQVGPGAGGEAVCEDAGVRKRDKAEDGCIEVRV